MKKRNKIALDLFTKKYRKRIVKPKKGKGSFKRRKKIDQFKFPLKKFTVNTSGLFGNFLSGLLNFKYSAADIFKVIRQ